MVNSFTKVSTPQPTIRTGSNVNYQTHLLHLFRLLATELVAPYADDLEALVLVLLVQVLQAHVL